MRHLIIASALAVLIAACGSYGGTAPVGGGHATGAPNAGTPNVTPLPTGNPSVDNYGY